MKIYWPIAAEFHIQPPGPLGKKNCSNDLGHMTNMAAMPIYGNMVEIVLRGSISNLLTFPCIG